MVVGLRSSDMRSPFLVASLVAVFCVLVGCGDPPVDRAWRADDATLATRVETLAAAREIDAAEGVFAALAARSVAGSVPEQRARLALARALVGLDRGSDAALHLDHLVWADKDPRIAAELLALQAMVQWRTLCVDGVPVTGALPAFADRDAPLGQPEGAWRARREAYAALATVLDRGVRLVRAEGGDVPLPASPSLLALTRYAYGDRTPAALATDLGATTTWTPALALAVLRVHLAEHAPEDALAAATVLFTNHPHSAEADRAFTLLRAWQVRRQRAEGTVRLWACPDLDALLAAEEPRREAAAVAAAVAALALVAADRDLNDAAVTTALKTMAAEPRVELDIESPTDVEEPSETKVEVRTSVNWKLATAWRGIHIQTPNEVIAGNPIPVTLTSEHRGDHQLALYRFADVAAWRTCAQKPSRDSLPSTVLSTHACEVGPWATLGQSATKTIELPALPAGFYVLTTMARGCPVVLVRGFTVIDADLRLTAAEDGLLAWVVTRGTGQARAHETLTAMLELVRDPAKAGGEAWTHADDAWRAGFRLAFVGSTESSWQADAPAFIAGRTAGTLAAQKDPVRLVTASAITDADGLARIPLPDGFAGRAWRARVAIDRRDVAIAATCDYGAVAAATTVWLGWADKPACRPGERLRFKMLLREWSGESWSRPTGTLPVTVRLGERDLLTADLPISDVGTLVGEIEVPLEAPVGQIRLSCAGSSQDLAEVIETRLPSLVVDLEQGAERVPAGAARVIAGAVRGAAGQALGDLAVMVQLTQTALDGREAPVPERKQITTDATGHFSLIVPTPRARDLQWRARIVAESGSERVVQVQSWTSIDFPIPLEATMLERTLRVGDVARVRLLLPAQATVVMAAVSADNEIIGIRQTITGTGKWQEYPVVVGAATVAIRLTATRADGGEAEQRLTLTVTPRPVSADATLTCEPESTRVVPGTKLAVTLGCTAPGRDVLVLGATARVHEARVVRMTDPAQRIDVSVTPAWAPNVELAAVAWIPGRGFVTSPRSTVTVLPIDRLLTVTTTAVDDDLRPGEETQVKVVVQDWQGKPAAGVSLSLGIIDERLYGLHEDQTPDLLDWFSRVSRKWSLVEGIPEPLPGLHADLWRSIAWSWQSVSTEGLFGNRQGGGRKRAVGRCGGCMRSMTVALAVLPEADATIHWNADLRTAVDGSAMVMVRLPDHAGRYRVTARANDASAAVLVGAVRGVLAVREPIACTIVVPEIVRPGDAFDARCELTNGLSVATTVRVDLKLGEIVVGTQQVLVQPGRRLAVSMPVRVLAGSSPLRRVGEVLGQATTLQATISVPDHRAVIATRDLLVLAAGAPHRSDVRMVGDGKPVSLAAASSAVWLRVRGWPDAATRRSDEVRSWLTATDARGLYAWLVAEDSTKRTTELARHWQIEHTDAWKLVRLIAARRAGQAVDAGDVPEGALGVWLAASGADVGLLPRPMAGISAEADPLAVIAVDMRLGTAGAGRRWLAQREQLTSSAPLLTLAFALDAARSAGDEMWVQRITSWVAQAAWTDPLDAVLVADLLSGLQPAATPVAGTLRWGDQRMTLPPGTWTTWSRNVDAPLFLEMPAGAVVAAEVIEQASEPALAATTMVMQGDTAVAAACLVNENPGVLRLTRPTSGWPAQIVLPALVRGRTANATMQVEDHVESTWQVPPPVDGEDDAARLARIAGVALPNAVTEKTVQAIGRLVTIPGDAAETILVPVEPIAVGTCTWAGGLLTVATDLPPEPPAAPFPLLAEAQVRLAAATPDERDALMTSEALSLEQWRDLLTALDPQAHHTRAQLTLHPDCGRRGHWSTQALEAWIRTPIDPDSEPALATWFPEVLIEVTADRALRQQMIDRLPFPHAVMPAPRPLRAWLQDALTRQALTIPDGESFDDWLWQQELTAAAIQQLGYPTDVDGWVDCLATEFGIHIRIGAGIASRDGEAGGGHLGLEGLLSIGIELRQTNEQLELVRIPGNRDPVVLGVSVVERPLSVVLAEINPDRVRRGLPTVDCAPQFAAIDVTLEAKRMRADQLIDVLARLVGGTVTKTSKGLHIE